MLLIRFNVLASLSFQHVFQLRKAMGSLLSETLTLELRTLPVRGILFSWNSCLSYHGLFSLLCLIDLTNTSYSSPCSSAITAPIPG